MLRFTDEESSNLVHSKPRRPNYGMPCNEGNMIYPAWHLHDYMAGKSLSGGEVIACQEN